MLGAGGGGDRWWRRTAVRPQPSVAASSGPGAADTASPCVQPQHQPSTLTSDPSVPKPVFTITEKAPTRAFSWLTRVYIVHSVSPLCSYKLFTNCASVPISHYMDTRQLPIATCYYSCYFSCYYCTVCVCSISTNSCRIFNSRQDFKVSVQLCNCCTCLLPCIDEKQHCFYGLNPTHNLH